MINAHEQRRLDNKTAIARFIWEQGTTAKADIAQSLHLSMPTVLGTVRELIQDGLVMEKGEYGSTGGRKAKRLVIAGGRYISAGVDITAGHVSCVILDLNGTPVISRREARSYCHNEEYYSHVRHLLDECLEAVSGARLLGVGVSLPGIVDPKKDQLERSHVLCLENVPLSQLRQWLGLPSAVFENDANSAAMAELYPGGGDAVYLSLSNSVGGSIYIRDQVYYGSHFRSAEFGHMVIEKGGRRCYCGKEGCADAYLNAGLLAAYAGSTESFFKALNAHEPEAQVLWGQYIDALAVLVSNLRMVFDCDIILGGYVGSYMEDRMAELGLRLAAYNRFESDLAYVRPCKYKTEAAAAGIARSFHRKFLSCTDNFL